MPAIRNKPAFCSLRTLSLLPVTLLSVATAAGHTTAAYAAQSAAPDPAALMRQAGALETASQWEKAAQIYGLAAKAYAANGQAAEQTHAYEKSAVMYEKYAASLTGGAATPVPATPAEATPRTAAIVGETPAGEIPAALPASAAPVSLPSSPIVHAGKSGTLTVASASGTPIDGVKISTHDLNIQCPSITVAPNGVIHAAFLEQVARIGTACAIYHRSSSDSGRTWSAAKNLSEVMPDRNVGMCKVAADGAGRVYVIWNVGSGQYNPASITPHGGGGYNNLVYRVLSGGQWNGKAIPIHQMATNANQQVGSDSYTVSVDPSGKVHVIWNEIPDRLHPEVMFSSTQHSADVGDGLVMEATLDGTTPSAPREIFMNPTTKNQMGTVMDGLDLLSGYVDATEQSHLLSLVAPSRGGEGTHFKVIENGAQASGVDLPNVPSTYWDYPPALLVDSEGRKHIVTMYEGGEHSNIRDYTVGIDSEPKTILAVQATAGSLRGFEGIQGPAGRMVALMNMNITGGKTDQELYVSMSNGGTWSTPINITNNSGRLAFHSNNTSARSNVATMSWGYPGACTATFDKSGHLLVLFVRNKLELFGTSAFGVELAGGSTATPNLMFLRF